jgi:hypothetical protein
MATIARKEKKSRYPFDEREVRIEMSALEAKALYAVLNQPEIPHAAKEIRRLLKLVLVDSRTGKIE